MELITANKRLNDLETSCKFLAEKYDALMTSIHDLKKHNKLSEFIATTLDIPQERTYTGQCSEPIMGFQDLHSISSLSARVSPYTSFVL